MNNVSEISDVDAVVRYRLFRPGAKPPLQGTAHAAGYDICAWISCNTENSCSENCECDPVVIISAGSMAKILTGVNLRIPEGYEVQVRPRSGLAAKYQITVMNSPGTIDADYDGDGADYEVVVLLKNTGPRAFVVEQGMRIAQLVVQKLPSVRFEEDHAENSCRLSSGRQGGLGSTGLNELNYSFEHKILSQTMAGDDQ